MTPHEYLVGVVDGQRMDPGDERTLRTLRDEIEGKLRHAFGSAPRFYYGGSFGKDTMIRSAYDLDIVMYFPSTEQATLRGIFDGVHSQLLRDGYIVQPKTVALRLPYQGGFHVDIVPGRAQDSSFKYATLYKNTGSGSSLQTSLKVHIDAVRKSGIRDVVKLLKLWRLRHQLNWPTFAIELTAALALKSHSKADLGSALMEVFKYTSSNLGRVRLIDPANTNNEIEIDAGTRTAVVAKANDALRASNWNQIV